MMINNVDLCIVWNSSEKLFLFHCFVKFFGLVHFRRASTPIESFKLFLQWFIPGPGKYARRPRSRAVVIQDAVVRLKIKLCVDSSLRRAPFEPCGRMGTGVLLLTRVFDTENEWGK